MDMDLPWTHSQINGMFMGWITMGAREWGYTLLVYLYAGTSDDDNASIDHSLDISSDDYSFISGVLRTWVGCTFMAVGGYLVSRWGSFLTISIGMFIESFGLFIMAIATNMATLYVAVFFISAGSGVMYTAVFPMLLDLFSDGSGAAISTGIALAGKQAGSAMASLSIIMAQSSLGWRGTTFLVMGLCSICAIAVLALYSQAKPLLGESTDGKLTSFEDTWLAIKRNASGFLLALWCGMTLAAFCDTFESSWSPTYFDDAYPTKENDFSILNAIISQLGCGSVGCILGGRLVEMDTGFLFLPGTAMMHQPAFGLVIASVFVVLMLFASSFKGAFIYYSLYILTAKSYPVGIMLAVQLIVKPAERGVLLGVFLFTYWIAASLFATVLGDMGMSVGNKLMVTAPTYLSAASILFIAGFYLPKYTIDNPAKTQMNGGAGHVTYPNPENETLIVRSDSVSRSTPESEAEAHIMDDVTHDGYEINDDVTLKELTDATDDPSA